MTPSKKAKAERKKMMKNSTSDILAGACVSITAAFLSKLTLDQLASDISDFTKENVQVHGRAPYATILKEFHRGGKNAKLLKSRLMPYSEAKTFIIKLFNYIDKDAMTNDMSFASFDICFDRLSVSVPKISELNTLKFALAFNDKLFAKKFPAIKENPMYSELDDDIHRNMFGVIFGGKEQFYLRQNEGSTVDLREISEEHVVFNCIGGAGYQKKKNDAIDVLDYCIMGLYRFLHDNKIGRNEEDKLNKLIIEMHDYKMAYMNPDMFSKYLPDIKLMVDLHTDPTIIKAVWEHIKDPIFKALVNIGSNNGMVNFESRDSSIQIKGFCLKKACLDNVTIVSCTGRGTFTNCKMHECILDSSFIENSEIGEKCAIEQSVVKETSAMQSSTLVKCAIENIKKIVDCQVEGGVWISGKYGKHTNVSDSTSVVFYEDKDIRPEEKNYGKYEEPSKSNYVNYDLNQYINI